MRIDRRRFIQVAGVAGPGALLALPSSALGSRSFAGEGGAGTAALVVDATRCRSCGACAAACTSGGRLPAPPNSSGRPAPPPESRVGARERCEPCRDRACIQACPEGALAIAGGNDRRPWSAGMAIGSAVVLGVVALRRRREQVDGRDGEAG